MDATAGRIAIRRSHGDRAVIGHAQHITTTLLQGKWHACPGVHQNRPVTVNSHAVRISVKSIANHHRTLRVTVSGSDVDAATDTASTTISSDNRNGLPGHFIDGARKARSRLQTDGSISGDTDTGRIINRICDVNGTRRFACTW